jgi:hypothetical protein
VENGFDKLFGYDGPLSETFEYCNTMKNSNIMKQLIYFNEYPKINSKFAPS